jgi:hypothetical protein
MVPTVREDHAARDRVAVHGGGERLREAERRAEGGVEIVEEA